MSVKFGLCKQIALAMFWVELRARVWINSKIASSLQSSSLSMPTLEPDQIHPFYSGDFFQRNVKNGMFRLFFSSDKTKTRGHHNEVQGSIPPFKGKAVVFLQICGYHIGSFAKGLGFKKIFETTI